MKKALIHEASDAREIALSEMSSIAGAARIVCRVGAIACLVPAALGVVGCLQWAVGGMLDGSFAKGFILAGSRALSQAAASAGPELLSLTTPDKAANGADKLTPAANGTVTATYNAEDTPPKQNGWASTAGTAVILATLVQLVLMVIMAVTLMLA